MDALQYLEAIANVASIVTAIIAGWAGSWFLYQRRQKRLRLENYLKAEKESGRDKGQRTLMHLVAELGMTETEVMDAAFRSRHILRRVSPDMFGAAARLFLEYSAKNSN